MLTVAISCSRKPGVKLRNLPLAGSVYVGERIDVHQIGEDLVRDLNHQFAHLGIGNARKIRPGNLSVRGHDLDVGIVAGFTGWENAGMKVLQFSVPHAELDEREGDMTLFFFT